MLNLRSPLKKLTLSNISEHVDLSAIDHSFDLLQKTALDVSREAIRTAKVLKDRLKQSESRYDNIVNVVDDLVLIKSTTGKWISLNSFGHSLFGVDTHKILNCTDEELIDAFPLLADIFEQEIQTDKQAWETANHVRYEIKLNVAQGKFVLDLIKTPIFNDDGTPKEIIVVGRDITKIREQSFKENMCFNVFNDASDPMFIVDDNLTIVFRNQKFCDTFAVDRFCKEINLSMIETQIIDIIENNTTNNIIIFNKQKMTLNVLPIMNGQVKPIYYICTFKNAN